MRSIFAERIFSCSFLLKSLENARSLFVILRFRRSLIIPQQETSGNYNGPSVQALPLSIIPQQETSGNYNQNTGVQLKLLIIPQQETSGNYNNNAEGFLGCSIIPQQETSGNYNLL